jgi:hypothetical protein
MRHLARLKRIDECAAIIGITAREKYVKSDFVVAADRCAGLYNGQGHGNTASVFPYARLF